MAIGDIGSVIDSEQWKVGDIRSPFISHARDNIYLISRASSFQAHSIQMGTDGSISSIIDTVILEVGGAGGCKEIVHIAGDIYAAAFNGIVNNNVVTFTCDAGGNLGGVIDTEVLSVKPTSVGYLPFLLHATGNIFIVGYSDNADDGWVKTLRINNDGSIDPFLDSWEPEPVKGNFPWIVHISGNIYALIISSEASNRGKIWTFSVDAVGNIAGIDSLIFEGTTNGYNGGIILPILGDNYAIFYQGALLTGIVKTLAIDNSGFISPVIDTWQFESTYCTDPHAVEVSSNQLGTGKIYCVGYGANGTTPQVFTIEIFNDGTINKSKLDTLTLFSGDFSSTLSIIELVLGIYAVVYEDLTGANSGWAKSFDIEAITPPTVKTDPATEIT